MPGYCAETFKFEPEIVNDFEAVAFSLPSLTAADVVRIGGGKPEPGAPMAVLGPGTGLGVAWLVPGFAKPIVVASEGGHATLAGVCDREDEIIKQLRERFGHVSAERLISGDGFKNIFQAVVALDGLDLAPRSAAEITGRALRGECQVAHEALARNYAHFWGLLPETSCSILARAAAPTSPAVFHRDS